MKKIVSILTILSMLLAVCIMPANADENIVQTYTQPPGAVQSATKMSVNGTDIFVEDYKDISYARFSFSGTAQISLTPDYVVSSFDISPHSYGIEGNLSNNTLNFTVDCERKLIVNFNNGKLLFVFADKIEDNAPKIGDENVYNLADYEGIDNTGETVITDKIQAALDDVGYNHPGGTLYIPNGKYLSGVLRIRSNTTVYLESGALIQGTSQAEDYPKPTVFSNGNAADISALICFDTAENSKITGRGTIDGDGKNLRQNTNETWLISVAYSKNCVVEDVVLRDPSAFGVHIMYCDDITFQRTKQIHDLTNPNTDGIDPDCSRNILIDNVFSYCSDDSVSVKTNRYSSLVRDTENITVSNNVFWTLKSALKIGDETCAHTEKNITFINNDVVHADRAVVLYVSDGSTVSDVKWINNRTEFIGGDTFKRIIDIWIHTRDESMNTPGKIKNLLIKDLYAEEQSENTSAIEGFDAEHLVENIYFDNYVIGGKKVTSLEEAGIITNEYVKNVVFGPAPAFEEEPEWQFQPGKIYMTSGGYASMEAEYCTSKKEDSEASWVLADENEKLGGLGEGSMKAVVPAHLENADVLAMPRLDYKVKFTEPGTYFIWSRLYAKDVENDYITVGVDGVPTAETGKIKPQVNNRGWFWSDSKKSEGYARIVIDTPGIHTINVWPGTDGVYFDKIVLYSNAPGDTVQQYNSPGKKGMGMPLSPMTDTISVSLDGALCRYEIEPVMINDRVMVPMRGIFESLGAQVTWDEANRKVTAVRNSDTIELVIDNPAAYKNANELVFDTAPVIKDGYTLVPIRFVSEMLNAKVDWDGALQSVTITTSEATDGSRVEIENMTLDGFTVSPNPYVDESAVVTTNYVGHASCQYSGMSGMKSFELVCYADPGTKSYYKLFAGGRILASGTVFGQKKGEPVTITVRGAEVNSKETITLESIVDSGEAAKFDYMKIYKGILPGGNGQEDNEPEGPQETVYQKIEAEDMTLNGYNVEAIADASGAKVVKTDYIGTAGFVFDGEDGTYTLKVSYFDENDGTAQYKVTQNGKKIAEFESDEDLGNASPIKDTLTARYITADLKKDDEIVIEGTLDGGESARLDCVEILYGKVEKEDQTNSGSSGAGFSGRIELEKTTLSGLTAEAISGASGGSVVRTDYMGTATFTYEGESGDKTIQVSYYDENDGSAKYKLTVGGQIVDQWTADEDKGNASPVSEVKVIRSIKAKVNKGDVVVLECQMDAGEPARADYIEIK